MRSHVLLPLQIIQVMINNGFILKNELNSCRVEITFVVNTHLIQSKVSLKFHFSVSKRIPLNRVYVLVCRKHKFIAANWLKKAKKS